MNYSASFVRKVAYVVVIAMLLPALYLLGQPAAKTSTGRNPGGKLARMRSRYGLAQAELGEIDPASETMRMATLGLRGVAASVLWSKANKYKMTHDWDNLSATLNQIAKLQPNFISVWEFQAHNLSYNVSAEFDDYRYRYEWAKKGIEFLLKGVRYNRHDSRLLWNLGYFIGHKIGQADEAKQFRRLFASDSDFHAALDGPIDIDAARGMDGKPDNWLVAYLWFRQSQRVAGAGVPITWLRENINVGGLTEKRRSPVVFNSDPPMALIDYAMAAEKDGYLDEKAQRAWMRAGRAWRDFGDIKIPTSWGVEIRLNDYEREIEAVERFRRELDTLVPGVRERLRRERMKLLTPEERQASAIPFPSRTWQQRRLAEQAARTISVQDAEVAEGADAAVLQEVKQVLGQLNRHLLNGQRITTYRTIVNYFYWGTRCEAEQTENAIRARKYVYDAQEYFNQADLLKAKENYENAWEQWASVFDTFPSLLHDVTAEELVAVVDRYRSLLGQLDEPFPEDFILQPLLDAQNDILLPSDFERQTTLERLRNSKPPGVEDEGAPDAEPTAPGEGGDTAPDQGADDSSDNNERLVDP